MGVCGQRPAAATLSSRKSPGTHCKGDWVSLVASQDRSGKSRPPPGSELPAVQPLASLYIDYTIPPTQRWSYVPKTNCNAD
jgi:hypothetical protein